MPRVRLIVLLGCLCLYTESCVRGSHNLLYLNENTEIDKSEEFEINNESYVAVLERTFRVLIYKFDTNRHKTLILNYSDDRYDHLSSASDFGVFDILRDGKKQVAWRYCKNHYCPYRSTVVALDVLSKDLFRLDYDEQAGGFTFTPNLDFPKNKQVKDWMMKWWAEWPGSPYLVPKDSELTGEK